MQTRSRSVDTGPPSDRRAEYRRVLFSSYLGTTIEFYDFLLYGSLRASAHAYDREEDEYADGNN